MGVVSDDEEYRPSTVRPGGRPHATPLLSS